MEPWFGNLVLPDTPVTPGAVRAGVRSLNGPQRKKINPGMFASGPQVGTGGSLSAYHPRLGERISDGIAGALQTIGLPRFSANQIGNRTSGFLNDFTPLGAATSAEDAKTAFNQGRYPAALGNALLAGLSAIPDGGALAGKVSHSIIAPLFHGSPHKFEKFALDKIGTGEGAQAYGHGLYFAENPKVALDYQRQLGGQPRIGGKDPFDGLPWMGRKQRDLAKEELQRMTAAGLQGDDAVIAAAESLNRKGHGIDSDWERQPIYDAANNLMLLRGKKWETPPGHLYEVKLDANPEDFLNWDAPLSEQPQIAERYKSLDNPLIQAWAQNGALPHIKGETAYRQIAGGLTRGAAEQGLHGQASQALRQAGIPGIRYLDQGSRGAGNGTSNYVVFDPSIIDILNRH